jgi:lambda family phage portal protein
MAKTIIYGANGQVISSKSGYGSAGASKRKRSLKGFDAMSGNPITDIDLHNETLRQRSRVLYMAAPIATSAIRTQRTNVIGCGLLLKSRIGKDILGIPSEDAAELERNIEAEWALWADDKLACDATGVNDFYGLQQLTLAAWLISGDCFALRKWSEPEHLRPYGLRIHVLEADRIVTPPQTEGRVLSPVMADGLLITGSSGNTEGMYEDNLVHDGVEVDAGGKVVAYHICSRHPQAQGSLFGDATWDRIEMVSPDTGLPNIMHLMDTERPEQYRGVPYLAQVIEPLLQSRRYTESELMSALVESFFTVFVKKEDGLDYGPLDETYDEDEEVSFDDNEIELGPGLVNRLKAGEDITFADPHRPASGYSAFVKAIATEMGAALEIPSDLLRKEFNSSYSASRAALLEAWKAFKMRRAWFVSDFCRPVYAAWLTEAVALGRIEAPGFFDDPLKRAAWLGAEWIGPSQGQLDPVKEVTAEILAIGEGLTTREQATTRLNGGNWDVNVAQLARENELLAAAGGGADGEIVKTVQTSVITEKEDDDGKSSKKEATAESAKTEE